MFRYPHCILLSPVLSRNQRRASATAVQVPLSCLLLPILPLYWPETDGMRAKPPSRCPPCILLSPLQPVDLNPARAS
jgi:hypothetical protein